MRVESALRKNLGQCRRAPSCMCPSTAAISNCIASSAGITKNNDSTVMYVSGTYKGGRDLANALQSERLHATREAAAPAGTAATAAQAGEEPAAEEPADLSRFV
eukprot:scaffold2655_cov400-Prasinococcus_capsulatus_cf.AAC.5